MTSRYDVIFPKDKRLTFDGGLNTKFERSLIQNNESPDCYNVVFTNGGVETRGGSTRLNTAAIGSFACDGLYTRRDNTSAETMVAFAGGTAWQLVNASSFTTIGSAQSIFTAGVRVGTAQYENHMFVGNGYVTPYKYNGVAWTRHGVPRASVSGLTGTVSGGGSLTTGTYYFKVAFVNSAAAIGDVSTATTGFSVTTTSGSINLTGIPTAPQSHGVNTRRIYEASAVGGNYALIATLNNNTATTYAVTGGETLSVAAPTDNGEPPIYSVAVYHQNRLFVNDAANPNYLWYSDLFEPYTFASTNFLPIGDASFDLIKGLDVYDNAVAVLCEASVTLIYMPSTDPADWQPKKTRSPYGSRSPFSTFQYNDRLALAGQQNGKFIGYIALRGSTLDAEATVLDRAVAGSDRISERIEPNMFDAVEAFQSNISAMVFKNKAYVTTTTGAGQTRNNICYVFDFSKTNLAKQQEASWGPISGINAAQFTVYNGKLYFGSSLADGFIYELETDTYSDNGSAINSYFWTKEFSGNVGEEDLQKDFRTAKLLVENLGAYNMNVIFRTDSDSGEGLLAEQVNLNPGSSLWGTMIWGVSDWGGGQAQQRLTIPLGLSGQRIQVKFSNQNVAGQGFKVLTMTINYNIKGKR